MADEKIKETISALIDGELGEEALRETLGRIDEVEREQACWRNYHLIGDAMRRGLPKRMDADLLDRIHRAIDEDAPLPSNVTPLPSRAEPSTPARKRPSHRTVRPMAGFALAASVAAVAYVGVGMIGEEELATLPVVASAPATPAPVAGAPAAAPMVVAEQPRPLRPERESDPAYRWDIAQPAMESRLDGYLSNHQAAAVAAGMQSKLMPNVRMVVLERSVAAQQ